MTNAETLEKFKKMAGGKGIAEIIEDAYAEGHGDSTSGYDLGNFYDGDWSASTTKRRLDNLLTKLSMTQEQ